jgi:hypothetical protein
MSKHEELYDVMKRGAQWSVDKKEGKNWIFVARFGTKKEALAYVASKGGTILK